MDADIGSRPNLIGAAPDIETVARRAPAAGGETDGTSTEDLQIPIEPRSGR
jgi:hypothetical protein